MNEKIEVLITEDELNEKISFLANQISEDFKDKEVVLICVLKGSIMFTADISKKIKNYVELAFIDVSSYHNNSFSTSNLIVNKELDTSIKGKHAIILEDIIDTGRTLSYLVSYLKEKSPASLSICSLLDKPSRRIIDVPVDYVGFVIPDNFVVGYGLDYAQKYRNLPYIGILHFLENTN